MFLQNEVILLEKFLYNYTSESLSYSLPQSIVSQPRNQYISTVEKTLLTNISLTNCLTFLFSDEFSK